MVPDRRRLEAKRCLERELIQERIRSGIAAVQARGKRLGLRIPTIAAIDSDRNQPSVPSEASRVFR